MLTVYFYPERILLYYAWSATNLVSERIKSSFNLKKFAYQIRSVSHVFGPYLRIFFSGITQRPVLQEKGPPQAGVL